MIQLSIKGGLYIIDATKETYKSKYKFLSYDILMQLKTVVPPAKPYMARIEQSGTVLTVLTADTEQELINLISAYLDTLFP